MSGYIETFESVDDSYLEHFGVPGMHWGQRRYQNSNGTYTSAGKKRRSVKVTLTNRQKDIKVKKERKQAVKNRRLLSDEELKSRVNRLQTEKQLKDLTSDDLNVGKKAVNETVKALGVAAGATISIATIYKNWPTIASAGKDMIKQSAELYKKI